MASIKFSSIVDDARGSIGGTVYSRNRYGAYVRSRTAPVQPRTSKQTAVRNQFTTFITRWRGLTVPEQAQWNTFAGIQPTVNRLGATRYLSGSQWFVKVNMTRYSLGLYSIVTPPPPVAIFAISDCTAVADQSLNTIVLTPTSGGSAADFYEVFATPPLSPGISFTGKSQFRLMGVFAGDDVTLALTSAYIATFGGLGGYTPGQVIHFKLVPCSPEGVAGTEYKFASTIIA